MARWPPAGARRQSWELVEPEVGADPQMKECLGECGSGAQGQDSIVGRLIRLSDWQAPFIGLARCW